MKTLKIPQILATPPDWLAVILAAAQGLTWVCAAVGLREVVKLIFP